MRSLYLFSLLLFAPVVGAQSISQEVGKEVGRFGKGVAQSIMDLQPHWETIEPRSKEECLKESGGVLDNRFVRCRNGRQEWVRYDTEGRRKVLQVRAIPN